MHVCLCLNSAPTQCGCFFLGLSAPQLETFYWLKHRKLCWDAQCGNHEVFHVVAIFCVLLASVMFSLHHIISQNKDDLTTLGVQLIVILMGLTTLNGHQNKKVQHFETIWSHNIFFPIKLIKLMDKENGWWMMDRVLLQVALFT